MQAEEKGVFGDSHYHAARVLNFESSAGERMAEYEEAFLAPPPAPGHSRAMRKLDFGSAPVVRGTHHVLPLRTGLQIGCNSSTRVLDKRQQTLMFGSQDAPALMSHYSPH
eukprot:jgi/Tetstr1/448110/TSEL_035408.t1